MFSACVGTVNLWLRFLKWKHLFVTSWRGQNNEMALALTEWLQGGTEAHLFWKLPSFRPNKSKGIEILVYERAVCLLPLRLILRITKLPKNPPRPVILSVHLIFYIYLLFGCAVKCAVVVPQSGIEAKPSAGEVWSPHHCLLLMSNHSVTFSSFQPHGLQHPKLPWSFSQETFKKERKNSCSL